MTPRRRLAGLAAIALAIAFNVPYALLAVSFGYPDVLRLPAGEVLDRFAAGGPALVLTWQAFLLTALALVPLATTLPLTPRRLRDSPAASIGAAIAGSLAGLAQAIGLSRWVFAVPALAQAHAAADAVPATQAAAEQAYAVLNSWGGVAIGEHLGQWLTALFVACPARLQWTERRRITALLGATTAAAIAVGTTEGVALALQRAGEPFALLTIAGFAGLTAWLIATGIGEWRGSPGPAAARTAATVPPTSSSPSSDN